MALSTTWQMVIFGVVFVVIGLLALGFFYISRKYPKQTKKADPILKWGIIILIIFLLHLSLVMFGITTQEQLRKSVKYYVAAFILVLVWFLVIKPMFFDKPISTIKLLNEYVLPDVRKLYNASIYKGNAAIPHFLFNKVIQSGFSVQSRELMEEKQVNLMESFLIRLAYGGTGVSFDVLAIRDKFTGEGLLNIKNPDLTTVYEYLGKDITRSYEEKLENENTSTSQTLATPRPQ